VEHYINSIDPRQYLILERLWRKMRFDSPQLIGLLFAMVEKRGYEDWQAWEDYYYKSGEKRLKEMRRFSEDFRTVLANPFIQDRGKLRWPVYLINYFNGRTKTEVEQMALSLYRQIESKESDISEAICIEFCRYKVVGEPWNRMQLRFRNTIDNLSEQQPGLKIRRTSSRFLGQFGCSATVSIGVRQWAGISIRSSAWLHLQNLLRIYEDRFQKKIGHFRQRYNSMSFTFYAQVDGDIVNRGELLKLKRLLQL
jgi:hypothetical protein